MDFAPEPIASPSIDEQDALLGVAADAPVRRVVRSLNETERTIFNAILQGKSFAEAARIAGVSRQSAVNLRKKIPDLMERRGLTDEILCAKLEQLLDAKETKFFSAKIDDEIIIEDREVEALDIQLRAFDLATKFKGWTRTVEPEEARDSHDINVNIINVGGGA